MPAYFYRALSQSGLPVEGSLEADNLADLGLRLQALELELLKAHPRLWRISARPGRRELGAFFVQLHQSLVAGLPLLQVLDAMAQEADHAALPQVARQLKADVQRGKSLNEAMARHPNVFEPVSLALIRAGEASGRLEQMLASILHRLAWEDEVASRLRKALLYPAIVGVVVGAVCLFLLLYLVPQLKDFLAALGLSLPWHTRALFSLSDGLQLFWKEILTLCVGLAALAAWLWHSPTWALAVGKFKLALPFWGKLHQNEVLSRTLASLSCLYGAGVPMLHGLELARGTAGNPWIERHLARIEEAVARGSAVSDAFAALGLCPPLVIRMLRLGESTGQLEAALTHVTEGYQRDIRDASASLQALLEPALILVLGAVLIWLAASILGPVYGLALGVGG